LDLRGRKWQEAGEDCIMRRSITCALHQRGAGIVARMGEMRNSYSILVVKREGKRPLGRRRGRWEDNIRIDFREIGWEDVDWMHLVQDRNQWRAVVNTVMKLRVP
jgi:hypothetical protein